MACLLVSTHVSAQTQHEVSLAGNAYVSHTADRTRVTDQGIRNWTSPETVVSAYFYVDKPQTITLSLKGSGHATMLMTCKGLEQRVCFDSDEPTVVGALKVPIAHAGYVQVNLQGAERAGSFFANISDIVVELNDGTITCVKDFSNYWGRRGPSVHMGYQLPKGEDYEWFYNEVTVPQDGETMSSYYMVAGFGEGYFGMQFNSPTERRVLFSVWSPFDTQDPRNIPEEMRVKLLKQGKDVHIGEFGNEGSGGQSFLRYPWKAGQTYAFLMRVHPDGKGNTAYTAFFKAPEEGEWRLIAKFLRPQTNTWYTHPHSFLENFNPEQGYLTRKVKYANQWARTRQSKWVRPESAIFTHDATAGAGVRLDYAGGVTPEGDAFYLKMGGFFDENVKGKERFAIPARPGDEAPKINFKALKKLEK
ncbi:MAG: DUF3472 domain-containing protein [Bacteroidales bacterium]|nr:DUF3472 domain-containing protein [Candidatus Physcousia equi]